MSQFSFSQYGLNISRLAAIIASASISFSAQATDTLRINVGGDQYTDLNGDVWLADYGYNTGRIFPSRGNKSIAGTDNDTLYQTQRFDSASGDELEYRFSVANGTYDIKLHFAETYSGAFGVGKRVFDMYVGADKVLANFDIYAAAGAANKAVVTTLNNIAVTDGELALVFAHLVKNPMLAGIEIIPVETSSIETTDTTSNTTFTQRINAGGIDYVDAAGNTWLADHNFTSGFISTRGDGKVIAGTDDDELYQLQRVNPNYQIEVPNGAYQVTLHFAETYSGNFGINERVFDVYVEDILGAQLVDPFKDAGSQFSATTRILPNVVVMDGTLDLRFESIIENPAIAAIEIESITLDNAIDSQTDETQKREDIDSVDDTIDFDAAPEIDDSTDTISAGNTYVFVGISEQPSSMSVVSGTQVSFSVTAKASHEITYQWFKDGQAVTNANAATLTISAVSSVDQGNYTCMVSAGGKSVTSSAAALEVATPSNVMLMWEAPTMRADGTTLASTEISGYEVYQSASIGGAPSLVATVNAAELSVTLENLDAGTHYFAIATVDTDGTRSQLSDLVSIDIE